MNFKCIIIRKEIKINETRTPLVPEDCKKLITMGIALYVEKNNKRCYEDNIYMMNGCIMIDCLNNLNNITFPYNKNEVLIIGLKNLDITQDLLFSYKHMYFSHTFKNQTDSSIILNKFKENNGFIYDMEYFTDTNDKRVCAFGFYAGIAGCYIGLLAYYKNMIKQKEPYPPINTFNSYTELLNDITRIKTDSNKSVPLIAIIGNGRCASGCIELLDELKLNYTIITKNMKEYNIIKYNIIINCILINEMIDPFITYDTLPKFINLKIIVDISCDYNNKYNPLPLYNKSSSFNSPYIKISNILIVAIDNLPSLLPVESSREFSKSITKLFNVSNENKIMWNKVINKYNNIIS